MRLPDAMPMIKRLLRVLLATLLIVVWWCVTPSLFRAEFEFGINIPYGVTSEWTVDRYYGPSRTMTALGFSDRWEEGSHTILIIPAARLVEFIEQFKRFHYSRAHGTPWSTNRLLKEPWVQQEVFCFRTTELRDGKYGDDLCLYITRLANSEFECSIRSSWD